MKALRECRTSIHAAIARLALMLAIGLAGCHVVDEVLDKDEDKDDTAGASDCYSSFDAFKRAMERDGKKLPSDQHWHHIVNQNPINKKRFPDRLHCTDNLIAIPASVHRKISGHYNSKQPWTRPKTVREVISAKSWDEQYEYGVRVLREHDIDP